MKDEIQRKIINSLHDKNMRGILTASVRSGKTRILLTSIKEHWKGKTSPKILILYPNIDIKVSWLREMEIIGYFPDVTFSTFASMTKIENTVWDYVCADEAHLLGEENQVPIMGTICKNNKHVILASGTYSPPTLVNLIVNTGLERIVNYSTEEAIKDGIVASYSIFIHQYKLDGNNVKQFGKVKKWNSTEVKELDRLSRKIINSYGKEKMFAALERMRFINSCDSLTKTVKKWISDNPEERFILFTSDEKTGLKYNLPMFNSKSVSNENLEKFQKGEINQLCLIKKGSAGVTFPSLKTILITAINSNGENLEQMLGRSLLNDSGSANIHIFVSSESFQQKWLNDALSGINKERIITKF